MMMWESMEETPLDKMQLFEDYISRYKYNDIKKAFNDFEEIFKILSNISYALQINSFNGHPRRPRDLEAEVTAVFSILCNEGVIDSYPFKNGDRYVSFAEQARGD